MGGGGPEGFLIVAVGVGARGGSSKFIVLIRLDPVSPVLIRLNQPLLLLDFRSSRKLEPPWLEGRPLVTAARLALALDGFWFWPSA